MMRYAAALLLLTAIGCGNPVPHPTMVCMPARDVQTRTPILVCQPVKQIENVPEGGKL